MSSQYILYDRNILCNFLNKTSLIKDISNLICDYVGSVNRSYKYDETIKHLKNVIEYVELACCKYVQSIFFTKQEIGIRMIRYAKIKDNSVKNNDKQMKTTFKINNIDEHINIDTSTYSHIPEYKRLIYTKYYPPNKPILFYDKNDIIIKIHNII